MRTIRPITDGVGVVPSELDDLSDKGPHAINFSTEGFIGEPLFQSLYDDVACAYRDALLATDYPSAIQNYNLAYGITPTCSPGNLVFIRERPLDYTLREPTSKFWVSPYFYMNGLACVALPTGLWIVNRSRNHLNGSTIPEFKAPYDDSYRSGARQVSFSTYKVPSQSQFSTDGWPLNNVHLYLRLLMATDLLRSRPVGRKRLNKYHKGFQF